MKASFLLAPSAPPAARALGFAGLIPFGALAIGAIAAGGTPGAAAHQLLIGSGAVILSFMGGCRWGLASAGMGEGPALAPLAVSVLPALYAWAVSVLEAPIAGLCLALGFAVLYAADVALTRSGGAPGWWPELRAPLTLGAVASLVAPSLL